MVEFNLAINFDEYHYLVERNKKRSHPMIKPCKSNLTSTKYRSAEALFYLFNLGRYEEEIASYDKPQQINPDDPISYYNKACAYSLQNAIKLALENLQKAIQLSPEEYREMSKTDSDFDNIRNYPRFQALIQ
ncbi:MAG: TPR end-of-group domain-containing protein [Pseudanabaena sp.]